MVEPAVRHVCICCAAFLWPLNNVDAHTLLHIVWRRRVFVSEYARVVGRPRCPFGRASPMLSRIDGALRAPIENSIFASRCGDIVHLRPCDSRRRTTFRVLFLPWRDHVFESLALR